MRQHQISCLLLIGWLSLPVILKAQSATANLSGVVQDEQEAAAPGARVILRDPAKGASREVVSGSEGKFAFADLPPSTYELTVELSGFAKFGQTLSISRIRRTSPTLLA